MILKFKENERSGGDGRRIGRKTDEENHLIQRQLLFAHLLQQIHLLNPTL
jgi:hypothetical protein